MGPIKMKIYPNQNFGGFTPVTKDKHVIIACFIFQQSHYYYKIGHLDMSYDGGLHLHKTVRTRKNFPQGKVAMRHGFFYL